jgi:hypothetical protein
VENLKRIYYVKERANTFNAILFESHTHSFRILSSHSSTSDLLTSLPAEAVNMNNNLEIMQTTKKERRARTTTTKELLNVLEPQDFILIHQG